MKKYLLKVALFGFLTLLFIEALCTLMLVSNIYLLNYPGKEIYHAISKSKQKSDSKILILGDSVASQLFPNSDDGDTINSLACNQAIGVVGQFLLLHNYLACGNEIDTLILIYSPTSFKDNLNQVYTFHYFLKPFNRTEYRKFFTPKVRQQIKKIPYHQFARIPHILVTSWSPKIKTDAAENDSFLSPISAEYLNKIKKLSMEYHFNLILYPTPVPMDDKMVMENIDKKVFAMNNLGDEFEAYFAKIEYLDDASFSDGVHLVDPASYFVDLKKSLFR